MKMSRFFFLALGMDGCKLQMTYACQFKAVWVWSRITTIMQSLLLERGKNIWVWIGHASVVTLTHGIVVSVRPLDWCNKQKGSSMSLICFLNMQLHSDYGSGAFIEDLFWFWIDISKSMILQTPSSSVHFTIFPINRAFAAIFHMN